MSGRDWVDCTCCGAVAAYDDEYGYFIDGQSLLCGCTGRIEANEGHVEVNTDACWCDYPTTKILPGTDAAGLVSYLNHGAPLVLSTDQASERLERILETWPELQEYTTWTKAYVKKPIDKDDFDDDEKTEPLNPPEIDWEALRKQYGTWAAKGNKTTTSSGPVDGWDNLDYMEPGVPASPPPDLKDLKPLTTDANGKAVCDCGSTKLGSDMHSDWCSLEQLGIKP